MKNYFIMMILCCLTFTQLAFAETSGVAIVKMLRGKVVVNEPGAQGTSLKKGDWVKKGSLIQTGSKSFVRLSFIDKSSMNIGPKSKIKIEKFSKKEAGVINVISGKIRSKVTKDYLNIQKGKSKLFVKSKTAVMGIRGTDFIFSTSAKTGASTAILLEGSVVFNKINKGDNLRNLEALVNRGRRIKPGEFSVASRKVKKATVPAKLNKKQIIRLERNENFQEGTKNSEQKKVKSIVPSGLSWESVQNDKESPQAEKTETDKTNRPTRDLSKTKGYRKGDEIKPVDGSFVHLESGTVIPMGADSQYDKNAGEWKSYQNGSVDSAGEYIPPAKHEINDKGQLFKQDPVTGKKLKVETKLGSTIGESKAFNEVSKSTTGVDVKPAEQVQTDSTNLAAPPVPQGCSTCLQPPSLSNQPPRPPPVKKPTGRIRGTVQDSTNAGP